MLIKLLIFAAALGALPAATVAAPSFHSERVLVLDRDTGETLYSKEAHVPAPIASVTKLMTAMVVLDEAPDFDEMLTVTEDDVDVIKNSSSRLPVGAALTRREMLHLALMSSENRAAHALARNSSKGLSGFIAAMNKKSRALSMRSARFVDPTGLSPKNRASAADLGRLVDAASSYSAITEFTTSSSEQVSVGGSQLQYRNSNPVVGREGWNVLVSKTGFIREAGRCVVMGFEAAGKNIAVILLGAGSSAERVQDLMKARNWVAGIPEQVVRAPRSKAVTRASSRGASKLASGPRLKHTSFVAKKAVPRKGGRRR